MLYPTLNQPLTILAMFVVGLASGIIVDIGRLLASLIGWQKFSRHFFDFLAVIFSCALLLFVNLKVNYGQFRLYIILIFSLSLILERFLSKILWTFIASKCYTSIENVKKKFFLRKKSGRKKEKQN